MALVSLFLSLLILPAAALAARVAAKESESVPWRRKAAVLGVLIGKTPVHDAAVVGALEQGLSKADEAKIDATEDAYDRVRSLLLDAFHLGSAPEEAALDKFIGRLRESKHMSLDLVQILESKLSSAHDESLRLVHVSDPNGGKGIDQLRVLAVDGAPGVMIGHYPAHEGRSSSEVNRLLHLLWTAERSMLWEGLFVRQYAQSHTAVEFATDPGTEVLIMFEPTHGSFREMLKQHDLQYEIRMKMFIKTLIIVQKLRTSRIPHTSDITPDSLFVIGDPTDPERLEIALSPEILCESTFPADDVYNSDTKMLGPLLRFLLSGVWPEKERNIINVFLAFGKALETGALTGSEGAAEFMKLLDRMSSDHITLEELSQERLYFLRLAVAAETRKKKERASKA